MKEIYFAGGCFWGTEHYFKQVRGVITTEVGYANGNTMQPTYEEVYTDTTGYAESVHVTYNEELVSLELLLRLFFESIDPLSLNQQGGDIGTRYRTGIYYVSEEDLPIIERVYSEVAHTVGAELAVEVEPLRNFFTAEEYHQDYLEKNPAGYCHIPRRMMLFAYHANREGDEV